jgi:photosystem II stability/assembly factor-like uncharacterized protein
MRNKIKILFILAFLPAVWGCSNSSTQNTSGNILEKTYNLSQSIWKSTNGGLAWEAKDKSSNKPRATDLDVLSIAISRQDSKNIFIGLRSGGIMKTTDGGDRWEFMSFSSQKAYGLALDPLNSKIIYASGVFENRGKIWKTEDGGENWKEIYTSASDGPLIVALAVDHKNPSVIYASTSDNQIIKSKDAGNSWGNIFKSANPVIQIILDNAQNNLVYFISNNGTLYRSRNAGADIEDIKSKYSGVVSFSSDFSVVRIDPSVSSRVYLAGKGGIIRSNDTGETWEKVKVLSDPESSPVTALAVNPKNSQEIIYGAGQATFRSVDGGANWTTSQFDTERNIRFLEYDPSNSAIVYIGFNK